MTEEAFYLKSMTAYGRGVSSFVYGRFSIEIQSVNRRFLEVNITLPKLFMRFEMDIRKQVAFHVGRGMVNVFVTWAPDLSQPASVKPNLSLARALKRAWEEIAADLSMEQSIPLDLLAQEKGLISYEEEIHDEALYRDALTVALKEALERLNEMKLHEGKSLVSDISRRLDHIDREISHINSLAFNSAEKLRKRLNDRLEELFKGSPENEERVLREIAIYSDKVDITEELVRFKSHLSQLKHFLEKQLGTKEETRGKKLDFLLQELNREINTIGSKASDFTIASSVVAIKSELEKIREQVQNIE